MVRDLTDPELIEEKLRKESIKSYLKEKVEDVGII